MKNPARWRGFWSFPGSDGMPRDSVVVQERTLNSDVTNCAVRDLYDPGTVVPPKIPLESEAQHAL